ncbi:hypothetical protein B0T18DRAFT_490873 [Schizothecium vesticola]|uniref:Uncharacterized protein n=1 Tax=Schizothecium vesticola TaxID=314040 RepID=A0AA40EIE4_9PEZI|nr:hypothetical protein B0T18DRAFT_490873 [Schizothecium vesticola]
MDDAALLRALAAATPSDAARILQKTLADNDVDLLTPKLLAAVNDGAIPPAVFVIYLSNAHHLGTLSAALRSRSSTVRRGAINHAGKLLRSEHEFDKTWNAIGGAPGIAALMRSLSLDDVDRLCRVVGKDLSGSKFSAAALAKRQQAVSQLLDLVSVLDPSKPTSMSDASSHRDPRPLDHLYAYLTPACTEQAREQWWTKQNPGKEKPKPSRPYPQWLEPGQEAKFHADIKLDHLTYTIDGIRWLLSHDKKHLEGILHSIAKADVQELEIKPAVFFNSNILPMAVSLPRKKLPPGMKAHIWDMIASSLQRWPLMAEQLDFSRGGLIRLAISRWDHAPTKESHARAGDILCNLLKLVPSTKVPYMDQWFQSGLFNIKPQHKYQLLLWLFRLTNRFGVDIEAPTEQDKEKLKQMQRFPIELFQEGLMPREKAVDFLHALAEIRPDKTFLRPANRHSHQMGTIFSTYQSPNSPSPCGDFEVLHHHLFTYLPPTDHPKHSSAILHVPSAAEAIKLRMDKAAKGRDAEDRFFWAQSALFMAIAAGSLALYSHTLTWTRRFDRDWQTLKLLYDADTLLTKEGVGLLSGIPSRLQLTFTSLSEIRTAMSAASQVVSQMFEAAAASIREPTFSPLNWSFLGGLIRHIVTCRFRRVETLQEHYGLSDDEVYALVWKPTMDMLLSVERFALQDEHRELRLAQRPGFPPYYLGREGHQDHAWSFQDHAWSFLDNLAKSRDELWHEERVRRFPSVLTLPALWPKGLPVADLYFHRFSEAPIKLPYVVSRAEAVLFASPETLLSPMPSDLEFKKAAGDFFDNYKACFDIYINGWPGTDGLSREERVARVWRYATTELTGSRMNKGEARAFWQTHVFGPLENWLPNPPEPLPLKLAAPVFPRTEDPSEPAEWHPDPGVRSQGSERKLDGPVTCLNCMFSSPARLSTAAPFEAFESLPSIPRLVVQTPPTPSFWDMQQYKRPFSGESQDAFIATALLSLQSKGGSGGLLMEPFPSPSLARFPAVYLSDEFLEEMGPAPQRSTNLELFQHSIPPMLLRRLATITGQRVMKAIGADVTWQERDNAFRVIKLLARCDQPGMARDLIRDIVLDNQDLSSWHRHLFSNGYFSRLSADEAQEFLGGIADAMIQRLKDQAQRRDAGANQESTAGSQPAIKVSTVKMLAQILRGAKFVGHETVCSTLGKILENACHIDIRIAVVQSLVDLFLSSRDAIELQTEIFDILKAHAVPLAASLSEREGTMSEEKWASAEKEGVLPPHEEGAGDVKALLLGVKDSQLSPDWRQRWAKEILGETMVQSSKNQARWQALFLKINNLGMPEGEDLPVIAASKILQLEFLMNRPQYMDQAYFERLVKLALVNLEPGPGLAGINSKIRREPGLKVSQAGNLWLARYGNEGCSALDLGPTYAAKLLLRPPSFWLSIPTDSRITVQLIQNFLYDVADIYIRKSDLTSFTIFVQRLNFMDSYSTTEAAWKSNTVPLLERLITRIDELRTPEWQRNPQRCPSRLPNTFGIRAKLLPFPSNRSDNNGTPPSDGEISVLAEALKALIVELANRGTPFQEDWTTLHAAATQASRSQAEFLRIALALAEDIVPALERDGDRQPNLAESLRIELAAELIRLGQDPKDDEVLWRAWDMMNRDWARSAVEFLRDRARTIVEELTLAEAKRGGAGFWGRIKKEALARAASLRGAEEVGVAGVEDGEVEGEGVEAAVTLRQAWGW